MGDIEVLDMRKIVPGEEALLLLEFRLCSLEELFPRKGFSGRNRSLSLAAVSLSLRWRVVFPRPEPRTLGSIVLLPGPGGGVGVDDCNVRLRPELHSHARCCDWVKGGVDPALGGSRALFRWRLLDSRKS